MTDNTEPVSPSLPHGALGPTAKAVVNRDAIFAMMDASPTGAPPPADVAFCESIPPEIHSHRYSPRASDRLRPIEDYEEEAFATVPAWTCRIDGYSGKLLTALLIVLAIYLFVQITNMAVIYHYGPTVAMTDGLEGGP